MKKNYLEPEVELVEVPIEGGFATTMETPSEGGDIGGDGEGEYNPWN